MNSFKSTENVTVVLRRQIPPRFDEAPRSWLGGQPMMPEDVQWPRSVSHEEPEAGEVPLHFLAQICCQDLPKNLWGGLGPREGWLLFFLHPNESLPRTPDSFKILHTRELGSIRQLPEDLGPVDTGDYSGGRYKNLLTGEQIPPVWRRWPVDLIVFPNQTTKVGGYTRTTPTNFAQVLYGGSSILNEHYPEVPEPFTNRMAVSVLEKIKANLERRYISEVEEISLPEHVEQKIKDQSFLKEMKMELAKVKEIIAQSGTPKSQVDNSLKIQAELKRATLRRDLLTRQIEFIEKYPNVRKITNYLLLSQYRKQEWCEVGIDLLSTEIQKLSEKDLDDDLPANNWSSLKKRLKKHKHSSWQVGQRRVSRGNYTIDLFEFNHSYWTLFMPRNSDLWEYVTQYYTDPKFHHLVPTAVRQYFEPWWRQLDEGRPHRMGGFHDGIQTDPFDRQADELLLMQIVTDVAMNWHWGDGGAYYFWINPTHLSNNNFSQVEAEFEGA
ncbi:DUF1963 domain-containing protein [Pseudovibrio sp. SCP19]|uniref:DUF1963 domain-containing protein n=1 Tax=Pseudovibrio sp. SCP19 TaxID=3141374 RepID=UPI00333A170B